MKTIKLNKSERRIFSLSFFVLISLSFLLLFCKSSAIRGEEAKDATSDASSSETIQGATIDDAPFEGSNILGVASNYNGFAAGNMYISGGSVTELEGRYAANEIKADTDYAGWGFSSVKWGTVTTLDEKSITPLFTANKIDPNITSDNKISSNLLKVQKGSGDEQTYVFNGNNKIIANNLFKYIKDGANDSSVNLDEAYKTRLKSILQPTRVGQTSDFRVNQDLLQGFSDVNLDPEADDATPYFTAAGKQISAISSYFSSMTTSPASSGDKNVVRVNKQVNNVTTQIDSSGVLQVDVTLPDDYDSDINYTKTPVIMLGIHQAIKGEYQQNQYLKVHINIHNMSDKTLQVDAGDESYPSYHYSPYILINWDVINSPEELSWNSSFEITAYGKDGQVINVPNATQNQLFSSHIINNFPNLTTATGNYAAFTFGGSGGFSGTILAPNASLEVSGSGGDTSHPYGSLITGKDLKISNNMSAARLISGSFNIHDVPRDIFEDLNPPQAQILTAQIENGENVHSIVPGKTNQTTLKLDQDTTSTTPVDLKMKILTRGQDYGIWYRFVGSGGVTDWQQLHPDTKELNIIEGDDYNSSLAINNLTITNLRRLIGYNSTLNKSAEFSNNNFNLGTTEFGSTYQRSNSIQVLVGPKTIDLNSPTLATDNQITTINLTETGDLKISVPKTFEMKPENSSTMTYQSAIKAKITNPWQVGYKLGVGYDWDYQPAEDHELYPMNSEALRNAATMEIIGKDGTYILGDKEGEPIWLRPSDKLLEVPASDEVDIKLKINILQFFGKEIYAEHTYDYPLKWTLAFDGVGT